MCINMLKSARRYLYYKVKWYYNVKNFGLVRFKSDSANMETQHLHDINYWSPDIVKELISSAQIAKKSFIGNPCTTMSLLKGYSVTILHEMDFKVQMAVSNAAYIMGAHSNIVLDVDFEQECIAQLYSSLSDVIFVNYHRHKSLQMFCDEATSPVICTESHEFQILQTLATLMTIKEKYKQFHNITLTYVGPPSPSLNAYLLLCPMVGLNLKFKCCCDKLPVSPITLHKCTELCCKYGTEVMQFLTSEDALKGTQAIVSGPKHPKPHIAEKFLLDINVIDKCDKDWVYFHTFPTGANEVSLIKHARSGTFDAISNMVWIAAACMARVTNKCIV